MKNRKLDKLKKIISIIFLFIFVIAINTNMVYAIYEQNQRIDLKPIELSNKYNTMHRLSSFLTNTKSLFNVNLYGLAEDPINPEDPDQPLDPNEPEQPDETDPTLNPDETDPVNPTDPDEPEPTPEQPGDIVDDTAPTIEFETNGSTTYKSTQGTKVTVTDDQGVDLDSLRYAWTRSTGKPSESSFTHTFENETVVSISEGSGAGFYLWVKAQDIAGNIAYESSNEFYLDNVMPGNPEVTFKSSVTGAEVQYGKYIEEDVIMTITEGLDETFSRFKSFKYTLNGGCTWIEINKESMNVNEQGKRVKDISIAANRQCDIQVKAVSNAGVESAGTDYFRIQKSPFQFDISPKDNGEFESSNTMKVKIQPTEGAPKTTFKYVECAYSEEPRYPAVGGAEWYLYSRGRNGYLYWGSD